MSNVQLDGCGPTPEPASSVAGQEELPPSQPEEQKQSRKRILRQDASGLREPPPTPAGGILNPMAVVVMDTHRYRLGTSVALFLVGVCIILLIVGLSTKTLMRKEKHFGSGNSSITERIDVTYFAASKMKNGVSIDGYSLSDATCGEEKTIHFSAAVHFILLIAYVVLFALLVLELKQEKSQGHAITCMLWLGTAAVFVHAAVVQKVRDTALPSNCNTLIVSMESYDAGPCWSCVLWSAFPSGLGAIFYVVNRYHPLCCGSKGSDPTNAQSISISALDGGDTSFGRDGPSPTFEAGSPQQRTRSNSSKMYSASPAKPPPPPPSDLPVNVDDVDASTVQKENTSGAVTPELLSMPSFEQI